VPPTRSSVNITRNNNRTNNYIKSGSKKNITIVDDLDNTQGSSETPTNNSYGGLSRPITSMSTSAWPPVVPFTPQTTKNANSKAV
jgi:hypothetical protein